MTNVLKDDLLHLKTRLETIENQLSGQVKEIELREQKWKKMDDDVEKIINGQKDIIRLNVGGKKFAACATTLMKYKDTLFYRLLETGKVDSSEEIFFDRSPKVFPMILDYFRTGRIDFKKLEKDYMELLRDDAEYYQIDEIASMLNERLKDIEFIRVETSGPFLYQGKTAGTGKIEDLNLKDRSCTKGICATSPGMIEIELNSEWEFETLEIGGWKGNNEIWYADNGSSSNIQTSLDKQTWKQVGTVPSGFGNSIVTVNLTPSVAKYIKFTNSSYIGIGYLSIKKKDALK